MWVLWSALLEIHEPEGFRWTGSAAIFVLHAMLMLPSVAAAVAYEALRGDEARARPELGRVFE